MSRLEIFLPSFSIYETCNVLISNTQALGSYHIPTPPREATKIAQTKIICHNDTQEHLRTLCIYHTGIVHETWVPETLREFDRHVTTSELHYGVSYIHVHSIISYEYP